MKYIKCAITIITLVLSGNVSAALIDNGTITLDDRTGLEWLDLTETVGMSYDQVTAQMVSGGSFDGWSYATSSQISSFFDSAGGSGTYTGWSAANNGVVEQVSTFWGYSRSLTQFSRFYQAEIDITRPDNAHLTGTLSDGINSQDPSNGDTMSLSSSSWPDAQAHEFIASALVRTSAVPIPPAVLLFGSGLLGLIGVARRKVRA